MIYCWQHLNAIQYGYRIAAEQQQLQQLQEQNRELQLTRAQLADPGRIDTLARNYGLVAPRPGQVVLPNAAVDPNPVAGGPVMAESRPAVPRVH
jgi:cell division protein FtsL